MKKNFAASLVAAGVLAVFTLNASAQADTAVQTNVVTLTNVVTVTVTNIVTVTNVVTAPAPAPAAAPAEPANAIVQPPKYPWASALDGGLTLARGNSSTLLVTGSLTTDKKTPENEYSFGADGAYGEANSKQNVNTVHGFGQYNHLFTDKFYGYLRVEGLHDEIADLQYRFTVGPGAGYYFIKETNTTFGMEAGTAFVTEKKGDETDNYESLRLAEKFEHKFKRFGARIWENVEVLPQVDDFNNYILNSEVGVESALSQTLSLKTYVVDNFNNQPAAGREKNDVKLVSSISYKF